VFERKILTRVLAVLVSYYLRFYIFDAGRWNPKSFNTSSVVPKRHLNKNGGSMSICGY
jgi:hypothetical protein